MGLYVFYKLQLNMFPDVLRTLYYSFTHPYILFGVEIHANTCKSLVFCNKSYRVHAAEL